MPRPAEILAGALLSLLFLLASGSRTELLSCAENVVLNGGFDTDLSAWSPVVGSGYARWDRLDARSSAFSGSVLIINNSRIEGQNTSISQCRPITGGISYDMSANAQPYTLSLESTRQPSHNGFGYYYALLNFYTRASCGGAPLNEYVFFDFNTLNAWGSLADTFIAPASAASAQITLAVYKGVAAGDLSCSFDDILLVVSGTSAQPDATSLCLGNGRFMARAQWTTRDG